MNVKKLLGAVAISTSMLALGSTAQAALIVDIDGVSGSGQTTWTFSGSAIASGGGFFEDDGNLGSTDSWSDIGHYTDINDLEALAVTSSATLTIAGITRNINLAYVDTDSGVDADDFGVGVDGSGGFTFADGDLISWSGSLVANIDIDDISLEGNPTTINTSSYGSSGTLLDLTINIGSASGTSGTVPAAPALALFGLGLGLLGIRRRQIK